MLEEKNELQIIWKRKCLIKDKNINYKENKI